MMRRCVSLLLTLAISFALQSCASTASPEATPSIYEPTAAAQATVAVILINMPLSGSDGDIIERLNSALESNGQRVSFKSRDVSTLPSGEGDPFLRKAREELMAGQPAADAYVLLPDDSLTFFNDGLTMHVAGLVQKNAPIYFGKYAEVFDKALSGIPVGMYAKPIWSRTALMLRSDCVPAGSGITTLNGLFRFLDESAAVQAQNAAVLADPRILVNQWALESGYYPLNAYGIGGNLYAALGDPECAPVPLESIPELDGFLRTMMRHYADGKLNGNFSPDSSRELVGFVKDLGDYFYHYPYQWMSWIPGEFAVIPLSPEMPSSFYGPTYTAELAIPVACPQEVATEVARFVEWYNLTQENHDMVVYGQQGVDFNITGTRFTPISNGGMGGAGQGLFYLWTGAAMFSNAELMRLPHNAPASVEQLYEDALKSGLRTEASGHLRYREIRAAMRKFDPAMQDTIRARNEALDTLIFAPPNTYDGTVYASCMDKLSKLDNDRLVDQCKRLIEGYAQK